MFVMLVVHFWFESILVGAEEKEHLEIDVCRMSKKYLKKTIV